MSRIVEHLTESHVTSDEAGRDWASSPAAPTLCPKIKSTACHRCHTRKVKCSGGSPCCNCQQAGKAPECIYPQRDRLVRVRQSYLNGLHKEIQRLRSGSETFGSVKSDLAPKGNTDQENRPVSSGVAGGDNGDQVHDMTPDSRPWFDHMNVFHTPILIGEAADAAFATRFRQALSGPNSPKPKHMLRVNYATDQELMALAESEVVWPSPSRSRLLIGVALKYVGCGYHIVRRSAILESLDQIIQNPSWGDISLHCKLWALLAIGELYSTRSASSWKGFPGLAYFAKAAKLLGVLDERPGINTIEIMNLLCFFSLAVNRRYSAFVLSGSAMRIAIVIGLHLNIPVSQLGDPEAREHRRRLFWTTYVFDRISASSLCFPPAIQDEEIKVNMPSNPLADQTLEGDFADPAYYIAQLQLASLISKVVRSIYRQTTQTATLSSRVQHVLKDLWTWVNDLPTQLRLDAITNTSTEPTPVPLHLFFNQCVILATRPVLLHILQIHVASWRESSPHDKPEIPSSAVTLLEACVRRARHSIQLLTECWVDGSFATFDYFYTQYLFSAMTVLAVSSILEGEESYTDQQSFHEASEFLAQLKVAGNFAAQEYHQHIEAITTSILAVFKNRRAARERPSSTELHMQESEALQGRPASPQQKLTTGITLIEPSVQELLALPVLDLQFLEDSRTSGYQGQYWPDWSTESWMAASEE